MPNEDNLISALNHLSKARNTLDKVLNTVYDLLNDEETKLLTDLGEHMHGAEEALEKE